MDPTNCKSKKSFFPPKMGEIWPFEKAGDPAFSQRQPGGDRGAEGHKRPALQADPAEISGFFKWPNSWSLKVGQIPRFSIEQPMAVTQRARHKNQPLVLVRRGGHRCRQRVVGGRGGRPGATARARVLPSEMGRLAHAAEVLCWHARQPVAAAHQVGPLSPWLRTDGGVRAAGCGGSVCRPAATIARSATLAHNPPTGHRRHTAQSVGCSSVAFSMFICHVKVCTRPPAVPSEGVVCKGPARRGSGAGGASCRG